MVSNAALKSRLINIDNLDKNMADKLTFLLKNVLQTRPLLHQNCPGGVLTTHYPVSLITAWGVYLAQFNFIAAFWVLDGTL